jgi:hypothetical protein
MSAAKIRIGGLAQATFLGDGNFKRRDYGTFLGRLSSEN